MAGGPLPVREFRDAAEMRAHYAALHRKCFQTDTVPKRQDAARLLAEQIEAAADLAARELVEPGHAKAAEDEPEEIPETIDTGLPPTTAQRERGGTIRGADCLRIVAQVTGLRQADLKGTTRLASIVKARQIAAWLLVNRAGKSLPEAGRALNRDHTTALHACRRVDSVRLPASVLRSDAVAIAVALWAETWPRHGASA